MDMIFLKLLFNSILIFIGSTAIDSRSGLSEFPWRLQEYVTPRHYNVTFDLEKIFLNGSETENVIYGICKAIIKIEKSTTYINLHAQYPHIEILEPASLSTYILNKRHLIANSMKTNHDNNTNIVKFYFGKNITNREYTMEIKFRGFVGDFEGSFKSVYISNKEVTK